MLDISILNRVNDSGASPASLDHGNLSADQLSAIASAFASTDVASDARVVTFLQESGATGLARALTSAVATPSRSDQFVVGPTPGGGSPFVIGGSIGGSGPAQPPPVRIAAFDGPRQFSNWDKLSPLERQFLQNQHRGAGGWDGIQRTATVGMLGNTNHPFWNDPEIKAAFEVGNLVGYNARLGRLMMHAAWEARRERSSG